MAYAVFHHPFKEATRVERYDEVYSEPRPYVSGGMFFGFGSINTEYRKDLISYKERILGLGLCKKCGEEKKSKNHEIFITP